MSEQNNNHEPTNQDILEAINVFATDVEKRFEGVDDEFKEIRGGMAAMATKEDLGRLKLDMFDAMDDKLANLKGDLVILMRKEDYKLLHLVEILKNKKILLEEDVREILRMEPFPKLIAS